MFKSIKPAIHTSLRIACIVSALGAIAFAIAAVESTRSGQLTIRIAISVATFLVLAYGCARLLEWMWKISGRLFDCQRSKAVQPRPRGIRQKALANISDRSYGRPRGNNA